MSLPLLDTLGDLEVIDFHSKFGSDETALYLGVRFSQEAFFQEARIYVRSDGRCVRPSVSDRQPRSNGDKASVFDEFRAMRRATAGISRGGVTKRWDGIGKKTTGAACSVR